MTPGDESLPTDHAIPSSEEFERAIYVDFEGPKTGPPVLLGVLRVTDGEERLSQYVIDAGFASAGLASGREVVDARTLLDRLAHEVSEGGVRVVAWSTRELTAFGQLASPEAAAILENAFFNAIMIAKRWRRVRAAEWMPPKPKRPGTGRHTLSAYMKKMGYQVPPILGPNNTGQRLRYVRTMLERRGSYEALTPTAKGKWTRLLAHNDHDCRGMRFVCLRAVYELQAEDGGTPERTSADAVR